MSLAVHDGVVPEPGGLLEQLLGLRRRWLLVALCTVLVPTLIFTALAHAPTRYTATGTLLYAPEQAAVPGSANAGTLNSLNDDAQTASQAAAITSLPVARELARDLRLQREPAFNPALRPPPWPFRAWRHGRALENIPEPAVSADVADSVRRALGAAVEPGSRVLAVSFTAPSAALAVAGANLAMQIYLARERDANFADMLNARAWLEDHAAAEQAALDATEAGLARARKSAGLVAGATGSLTAEAASRLTGELIQAQAIAAADAARLRAAHAGTAAAADAEIAPNLLPLRQRAAELAGRVRSLGQQYGPDYPALRAARAELAAVDAQISREAGREIAAAQAGLAAARAEVATLQAALGAARGVAETQDRETTPMRALEQRAAAEQDELRAMTLQASTLMQDASLTRPAARILSQAVPPGAPDGPHRGLVLAAALGLGLSCGLLLSGFLEALDTSFRSGEALRAAVRLPCLALLPELEAPLDAGHLTPFSLFAEQLRALQSGLGLVAGAGRVLAVTAARPDEGKTTLTVALARALSFAGLRVLAVDGDLRQPSFDAVFGTGGAPGLTDHLAGLVPLEAVLRRDPASPLTVLPAGTQAGAALALFLSPALPECLAELRTRYDAVLLDVPPAFALAEGRVLAGLADGALLCVRWGKTPRRVVLAAQRLLQEAGATLLGAALTRVDAKAHRRSGYADAEAYQPRYGGYFRP